MLGYAEDLMSIKLIQDPGLNSSSGVNELHFEKKKKSCLDVSLIFVHLFPSYKSELGVQLCDLLGIMV